MGNSGKRYQLAYNDVWNGEITGVKWKAAAYEMRNQMDYLMKKYAA